MIEWNKKNNVLLLQCKTQADYLNHFPGFHIETLSRHKRRLLEKNKSFSSSDIKVVLVGADSHIPDEHKPTVRIFEHLMQDLHPDQVILLGDMIDCKPLSHWIETKQGQVEGRRIEADYQKFDEYLKRWEKLTKSLVWMEGNHENWVEQYLDKAPTLRGMIEVPLWFKLAERKIKWVPFGAVHNYGKQYFIHGLYHGSWHAKQTVEAYKRSVMYGDMHSHQIWTDISPIDVEDVHSGTAVPCMCEKNPDYMFGRPNRWIHGMAVIYFLPDGTFFPYIIKVTNDRAIFNGKVYVG